jgi:hypothetical protein
MLFRRKARARRSVAMARVSPQVRVTSNQSPAVPDAVATAAGLGRGRYSAPTAGSAAGGLPRRRRARPSCSEIGGRGDLGCGDSVAG